MANVSAIAVDFGSTNSGCAKIASFDQNGNIKYDTPELIHSIGEYAKDNTWFYIEPSFMERLISNFDGIADSDFRIESREMHVDNPNIIWGRKSIYEFADKIISENWKGFKNFKMWLRDGTSDAASDYPLVIIIKTFLRILKIECLACESKRLGRSAQSDEILWGVTIPAVWNDENKRVMRECAHSVFSEKARVLSEPEGPLVAHLMTSSADGKAHFKEGRTSLVIDAGGGTTDICLMHEVKQPDGSYKLEMVADSDGSAVGGNDIDEHFYIYLLRFISKGKKTDAGVSYDSMSDKELMRDAFNGFKFNIREFIEFENNWLSLKGSKGLGRKSTVDFNITIGYKKWLEANGHNELATAVKELLIDGCELPSESFVEQVLTPTVSKICDKVREIIHTTKDKTTIDSIILAGGMSLNFTLKSMLTQVVEEELGTSQIIHDSTGIFAGSAVMTGTCYILVNRDAIVRLAKRTYYYDSEYVCSGKLQSLRDKYVALGENISLGRLNTLYDEETGQYGSSSVFLSPITIKGKTVQPFHVSLYTSEDQFRVEILLYSTDGDIVLVSNDENPLLHKEGELHFDCNGEAQYDLEVDFNEAVISGDLHYILKRMDTGETVAEGFIQDAF